MKFLRFTVKIGPSLWTILALLVAIIQSRSSVCDKDQCDFTTKDQLLSNNDGENKLLEADSQLDLTSIQNFKDFQTTDGPQTRILIDSDPISLTLSSRFRTAFSNLQAILRQYSDKTVVFILVIVTSVLVMFAAAFVIIFGPMITAIASLVLPFAVLGLIAVPLLLQPPSILQRSVLGAILPWMAVFAINDTADANVLLTDYLPSDTVTELSGTFAVTKASLRSGTTSTVRPWPSHSFFRSVLSRFDNVVVNGVNGSVHTQTDNGAGILVDKSNSTSHINVAQPHFKSQNSLKHSKHNNKKTRKRYQVNRKRNDNKGKNDDKSISAIPKSQSASDGNNTRARAVVMTKLSVSSNNASTVLQRKFSTSFLPEKQQQSKYAFGSISTKNPDKSVENFTNPSQPENYIVNEMNKNYNEYSHLNSPHIGFQYEIVLPPPAHSPRPALFKLTENANLSHTPATTTATLSTSLQPVHQHNSSGVNNAIRSADKGSKNIMNTSSLAVNEDDAGKKVANDDAATTSPLSLESQIEQSKHDETAVANTKPPPATQTLPKFSNFYNSSNEMILQNPQYSSSSTPTQPPTQLDAMLGNSSSGENITYNKNHLPPTTEKANYSYIEIKKDDLPTINNNFSDFDDSSSNNYNTPFILEEPFSTFLSSTNIKRKQSESTFSISAQGTDTRSSASVVRVNSTMKPAAYTTTFQWKPPPTHFSSQHTQYETHKHVHVEPTNNTNKVLPNQLLKRHDREHMDHFKKKDRFADNNHSSFQGPLKRPKDGNQIALLNRRNMYTVVKTGKTIPKLHVESGNATSIKSKYPADKLLHDRTNQVERPSLTTNILTGPDRTIVSASSTYVERDNDYFDEDDSQKNLHHWIESEQGHFVNPSSELPRFTNLTWPYYITSTSESVSQSQGNTTGKGDAGVTGGTAAAASTALAVSFNSVRNEKPDFNKDFEFYIPSAAADPHQNPILLAKKRPTTTTATPSTVHSWTSAPNVGLTTPVLENWKEGLNLLKQEPHKNKIKQNHWGSQGLSTIKPRPFNNDKLSAFNENQLNKIKIYENSTGSPKSTPFPPNFLSVDKAPVTSIVSIHSTKKKPPLVQQYFVTSPSASLSSTWPFAGNEEILGHSETASFATSKTPTNIWYKPIINHFTASVPINGSNVLFDGVNDKVFNDPLEIGGSAITTTSQPLNITRIDYVGGNDDEEVSFNNTNLENKVVPGKFSPGGESNTTKPEKHNNDSKRPILFKVWNIVDGKLKLENQREIPAWALKGFVIPTSGTILNLQQIPPSLQPLVTSAITVNKATEHPTMHNKSASAFVWKQLPILDNFGTPVFSSVMSTTHFPTRADISTVGASTNGISDEPLFDNESNQIKIASNKMGWYEETAVKQSSSKQPISINYVLWNNPASIYGQSIILSTPTPQILLSRQPTPLPYFPSSVITLGENTPQPSVPYGAAVKNPGSSTNSYITPTTSKPTTTTTATTTSTFSSPPATNIDQEKLELLFQNYFQYFITTSTPAPTTTTTTTENLLVLANKVTDDPNGQQVKNKKAWTDLKKLILRLASTKKPENTDNRASLTLDKDKAKDLDYLGNVAAVALIMSYLRNQYEKGEVATTPQSATPAPYGVTDDMTPPHKDQLWATVYPLFQHFLNNPNYTFIPPPPPQLSNQQLLSESLFEEKTPTSSDLISFTEPPTGTGGSSYFTKNTEYNHYVSYYPAVTTKSSPLSHKMSATAMPRRGATTAPPQLDDKDVEIADDESDVDLNSHKKKKTLVITRKIRRKKERADNLGYKDKGDKGSKSLFHKLLHKKLLKKPFAKLSKKPKKYWLDLKFEIDFIEILKKKYLYLLALQYMPVVLVLAFGVLPLALSLVPLIYKIWWMKFKKSKHIKIPIPYPKPYPVPVYKPPPYHYGSHYSHSPVQGQFIRPGTTYEKDHDHGHHYNDNVMHIDSPPMAVDHHYAADTTGNDNSNENDKKYGYKHIQLPERERGDYSGLVNSFNYDPVKHSPSTTHTGSDYLQQKYPGNSYHTSQQDQEVHVHLHDEESVHLPQYQNAPVSDSPSIAYTSYNEKDMQPYPTTQGYGMGFDVGNTLAAMTNKHDMEILKILFENKKEKLSKLLDMWNLAKYGAAVASDAAVNALGGGSKPPTPTYSNSGKKKRKRRKRRKKRKHSIDSSPAMNVIANYVNTTMSSA